MVKKKKRERNSKEKQRSENEEPAFEFRLNILKIYNSTRQYANLRDKHGTFKQHQLYSMVIYLQQFYVIMARDCKKILIC